MDAVMIAVIVCAIVDIPVFILIGKWFFGSWQEFWDAVIFWLTPDILSAFTGEYWDDLRAEIKLGAFVAICIGLVLGEILLITELFIPAGVT